jgi:hypothetical protein
MVREIEREILRDWLLIRTVFRLGRKALAAPRPTHSLRGTALEAKLMAETPHGQGTLFTVDRMGRRVPGIVWWDLCPTCRVATPEPHDHSAADLELILAELRRVKVEQPASAPELGEHLTLRELARYAKRSSKWLRERTRDSVDPLPCERPSRGKVTFRRSAYDKWIERQRTQSGAAVSGVVDEVIDKLTRGRS